MKCLFLFAFLLILLPLLILQVRAGRASAPSARSGDGSGAAPLKVGQTAPEITLESLLQAPSGAEATRKALSGKVVVLEFWGTYCAPCIAALPQFNRLVGEFAKEPVQFIAITHESRAAVERFLSRRTIEGWVGLDTDESVFRAYHIDAVPTTIVIDRQGRLAARGHPTNLTPQVLRDVLAGRAAAMAGAEPASATPDSDANPLMGDKSLLRVVIQATKSRGSPRQMPPGVTPATDAFTWIDASVDELMGWVYGGSKVRRVWRAGELKADHFDVSLSVPPAPGAYQTLRALAKSAIETALGISARRIPQETDVYVLRLAEGNVRLTPTTSRGGYRSAAPGQVVLVNAPVATLASILELQLDRPVVDETSNTQEFDVDLSWQAGDQDSLVDALRKQLGLAMTQEKRQIEILVISKHTGES